MTAERKMPSKIDLGRQLSGCMGEVIHHNEKREELNPLGLRVVMGYFLPTWQRGLVWSEAQKISFLESAWRGINLGTYTFNRLYGSPHDNLLIDGQQRLHAVECYINDEFPVFGYRWSETTVVDKRSFRNGVIFGSYITETNDEEYLRGYYNLMNFGGVAHKESERA